MTEEGSQLAKSSDLAIISSSVVNASDVAAEVFLQDMKHRAARRRVVEEAALSDVAARERLLFQLMVLTATLAPILLIVGAALAIAGFLEVGVLAALLGLVDGAGSAGLRRLQGAANNDRRALEAVDRRDAALSQALAVTFMIPDEKRRAAAVEELAATMTDSVRSGAPRRSPRRAPTRRAPRRG